MTKITPPKGRGALARRETRLAWSPLFPTIAAVALVVVLPLFAVFRISFRPVGLADLRPPTPMVRESPRTRGEVPEMEYRLRNSSRDLEITDAVRSDTPPEGVSFAGDLPGFCRLDGREITCRIDRMAGGYDERVRVPVEIAGDIDAAEAALEGSLPAIRGSSENILTNAQFTLDNLRRVFDGGEFLATLGVTLFHTVFGTIGAILLGLFAALLLNGWFRGQGFLRGLCLFPGMAQIIAVAFAWVILFDPFSGSANAPLVQMGVGAGPPGRW